MSSRRLLFLLAAALSVAALPARAQVIITLQNATAGFSQGGFPVTAAIDGDFSNGGWAHDGAHFDDAAVFETTADAIFTSYEFTMTMVFTGDHMIGHFRVSTTTDDRSTFADGLINGGDITANWTILTPDNLVSSGGATMTLLNDGSVLVGGLLPGIDTYTFSANSSPTPITGFRLEVLTDASLPANGPGRASNGNFVLTEFAIVAIPEPSTYALLGAGLLALGLVTRRRRN
jgi:hypothetical protein